MNLRRAIVIAASMLALAAGSAVAQSPWPQQPQQSPWPQQSPQQPVQPQEPPCFKDFIKLRSDAEKKAKAIQAASERKAPAREACGLFNAFSSAEAKMVKFATDNASSCGIPAQVIDSMKQAHAKTNGIRANVCRAAAAPARPAGPSLSDALSAPVPNSGNIKSGGGTFDTLTGTPLGSK